jgi:hypothetical protein
MTFYCGIDLHAKKSQMCIIEEGEEGEGGESR